LPTVTKKINVTMEVLETSRIAQVCSLKLEATNIL